MTKLGELLVKQVQNHGWLSVSSVTFDNVSVVNIAHQSGDVGIDVNNGIVIWTSTEDTANTQIIMNKVATQDVRKIGLAQTVVMQDIDCLQWWQAALLTYNYTLENPAKTFDDMKNHPIPTITYPSESDILSATYDEETGLWTCPNVATALDAGMFRDMSVVPLYDSDVNTMSSAIVEEWFRWYTEHQRFKDYIKSQFDLTII